MHPSRCDAQAPSEPAEFVDITAARPVHQATDAHGRARGGATTVAWVLVACLAVGAGSWQGDPVGARLLGS
jgi:hypothetical protein